MQKILVHFDFPSGNAQQYDNVWKEIIAAGHEHPKGLLYHAGAPKPDGGWVVFDVWESEDAFREFGKVLIPIIEKSEIPLVQPNIHPVHKIVEGIAATA